MKNNQNNNNPDSDQSQPRQPPQPKTQGIRNYQAKNQNRLSQQQKKRILHQYQLLQQQFKKTRPTKGAKNRAQQIFQQIKQQKHIKPGQRKQIESIVNKGRPTYQQIQTKYTGLKQLPYQPVKRQINGMKQIDQKIKQAYKFATQHQYNQQKVWQLAKVKDSQVNKLYCMLKDYTGSYAARLKVQRAAYGKLRGKYARDHNIPLHDADILILLDDWKDSIKQLGSDVYNSATNWLSQNKSTIYPLISGLLTSINPSLGAMSGMALQSFGGALLCQDPYANSVPYMKYIYGVGQPHPCPRFQSHYMYQMTSRLQVPVTTLSDGTALVTIIPNSLFAPSTIINLQAFLPFVSVAQTSTTTPFLVTPSFMASPFNSQRNNASTYALDSLRIDYLHTQSPLNAKGKYSCAFYYQPVNDSWQCSSNGQYTIASISLTDTQIVNDVGYVLRKSCVQSSRLTSLGTYINQKDKVSLLPIDYDQNNIAVDQKLTQSQINIKFTGCTPGVNVGTMFITVSASIQPIGLMRGILKVTPRGSYQGFFRITKQARKMGIPLQFLTSKQACAMYKQHFGQVNFQQLAQSIQTQFGQGNAVVPAGFRLLYNPQKKGFCVHDSMQYIGFKTVNKPWMNFGDVIDYPVNILISQHGLIVDKSIKNPTQVYLVLDQIQKHAFVVTTLDNTVRNINQFKTVNSSLSKIKLDQVGYTQCDYYKTTNKSQYPVSIFDIPSQLKMLLIQNNIVYAPIHCVQQPLKYFDLSLIQDNFASPNGLVKVVGSHLIVTDYINSTKQIVIMKPTISQVQKALGMLLHIQGRFLDFQSDKSFNGLFVSDTKQYYTNKQVLKFLSQVQMFDYFQNYQSDQQQPAQVSKKINVKNKVSYDSSKSNSVQNLNNSGLSTYIKSRLVTIQPNPGPPRHNNYKYKFIFNQAKTKPLTKLKYVIAKIDKLNHKKVKYFSCQQPTIYHDSDIQQSNLQSLVRKISDRSDSSAVFQPLELQQQSNQQQIPN